MRKTRTIDRQSASLPTIRRLPAYLQIVRQAEQDGILVISGTTIAEDLELEPIQVRKDLAVTGIIGKPRVGYIVKDLVNALEHFLRWDLSHDAVLIGAGNLGAALLGHSDFRKNGLNIVATFDINSEKVGKRFHGVEVFSMLNLEEKLKGKNIEMGILTVPAHVAQETANRLFALGIKSIWNFTSIKIKAPEGIKGISVQKEDLSSGYAVLSVGR